MRGVVLGLFLVLAFEGAVASRISAQSMAPRVSSSAAHGTRVVLPGGTTVPVAVANKISSATANVGDTFAIRATEDVVVNGWIAIAKGAAGLGKIVSVDRAGKHGHPGSLGVRLDWIYAVDGNKVKLTSQPETAEGHGEQGKSSTLTIVSSAFLGIPGLFAHNFVKGHDVEIGSTYPLTAYVDDSVSVVASSHGAAVPIVPTAYVPPVAPENASPTAKRPTIFESAGTGPETSKPFVVTNLWAIAWSYDCTTAPTSAPTSAATSAATSGAAFSVNIQGGGAQSSITPSGTTGIDITHFRGGGTYYLTIESGCSWHVRVFDESN